MSASLEFDPGDYIDDISDVQIAREYDRRNLASDNVMLLAMRDAYTELMIGRALEARAILERVLYPKWDSEDECKQAYNKRR